MAGQQTKGRRYEYVDNGGEPTKADERERRRAARDRDAPLERAYKAGQRGAPREELLELAAGSDYSADELEGYYDQGAGDAASGAKAERRAARGDALRGQVGAAGARAGSLANDGAGFLLGLIGYALLANYLRHGTPGVKGWLSAKFLNQPRPGLNARGAARTGAGGIAAGASGGVR